jgi:hypothetical protein
MSTVGGFSFGQRPLKSAAVLLAILSISSAAMAKPQDEKVVLQVKGVEGSTTQYKSTAKVNLSFSGQDVKLDVEETTKVTVKKVAEDGSITFERETLKSTTTVDGEEMDEDPDAPDITTTFTLKPNGEMTAYKTSEEESDPAMQELESRLSQANAVVFTDKAVGVGDKWTWDFKANKDLGSPDGKAEYTLVGFEEIDGVKVAKVEYKYKEANTEKMIEGSGTSWIELASGDAIKSDSKFSNAPFDAGGQMIAASGSGTSARASGTFLSAAADTDGGTTPDEPKEEEDNIDKKVKDFEKIDGFLPLYRKVDDGRVRLYMEVPKNKIGPLLMLQATASSGTGVESQMVAGTPISDIVFRFEEMPNNKLYVVVPNYLFRADSDKAIDNAVKRSFSDSYIDSFDIEARQKDRDSVLIDVSELFLGNIAHVQEALMGGGGPFGGGGSSYSPDREKSFIKTLKNFPTNMFVESVYVFQGGRGGGGIEELLGGGGTLADSRSLTLRVNYNLWQVAEDSYRPRRFDSRIGFFTTEYQDFSDDLAVDQKVVNITRWNLVKKNPEAELSEPVKPIVFWLDNAIPVPYRETVRDALLEWNKAFEKVGYKNAIVVNQMPDQADFDHADMRYNVIRWVASQSDAYAVALFRVNPITGEIVNASVTVDSGIVRAFAAEHDGLVNPASAFKRETPAERAAHIKAYGFDCTAERDALRSAQFGMLALEMVGAPISKTAYVKQFIKWVVMHEFGHTLGLRHNFVASTQLNLEQMGDEALVSRLGTSASVMDYIPFNIAALKGGVDYFGQTIGSYDYWAIRYGYLDIPEASNPDAEVYKLAQIAKAGKAEGYEWQGDETADFNDPFVTRFDLTAQPLDYWSKMMQTTRHLLFSLDKRLPKPGESYWTFTRDFNSLMGMYAQGASQATRYIGGVRRSNSFAGDANGRKPIESIPAVDQRRALAIVNKYIFAENAFEFPKSYYSMFASNPKAGILESMMGGMEDYPMFDQFSSIQSGALSAIFNGGTLNSLMNAEFKSSNPADTLTPMELMKTVRASIWSELASSKTISPLRRQLQREHIETLLDLGVRSNSSRREMNTLALSEVRNIQKMIRAAKPKDAATRAHLSELDLGITRALNSIETLGGGYSPPSGGSLMDLLGGVKK